MTGQVWNPVAQKFDPAPTLAEFLLECIAEDEVDARGWRAFPDEVQCPCGRAGYIDKPIEINDGRLRPFSVTHVVGGIPPQVVAGHVVSGWEASTLTHELNDEQAREVYDTFPLSKTAARVLAECEAKRRIVELHHDAGDGGCYGCGFGSDEERMNTVDDCPTLRLLTLPYADHPAFRPEWASLTP